MRSLFALVCLLVCCTGCKLDRSESSLDKWKTDASANDQKQVAPIDGIEALPGATEVRRREYDEGGFHIKELILGTEAKPDEIKAFYEPRLKAKEMPMAAGVVSIQNDMNGKHYEVSYSRTEGMDGVTITVKTPTQ